MNRFYSNSHTFYLTSQDLANLQKFPMPNLIFNTKIVFNPEEFLEKDLTNDEICQLFINGDCKSVKTCKKYHPKILNDSECMICKAKVRASLRRFGLMNGCQCIFCYPCIRQWRSRGNVGSEVANSCPICGIVSIELIQSSICPANFCDRIAIIQLLSFAKLQNDII